MATNKIITLTAEEQATLLEMVNARIDIKEAELAEAKKGKLAWIVGHDDADKIAATLAKLRTINRKLSGNG